MSEVDLLHGMGGIGRGEICFSLPLPVSQVPTGHRGCGRGCGHGRHVDTNGTSGKKKVDQGWNNPPL
jgi:hypothetical protein